MSPTSSYRFINPATLAAIGNLPLAARRVVDGFMFGAHASRLPGAGLEFNQYRSYQAGDDLRRVDWKLFGRSDRYFVRESEVETSLTLRLVIDATGSMAQAEGLTKFDYARFAAAALAVLAHRNSDAVGLYAVSNGGFEGLRPARGQPHLDRCMHVLEGLRPRGTWPEWGDLERVLSAGRERGITVLITDLHERADEIRDAVGKLASMRHEVIVMHIVGEKELELGYQGPVVLEELETGRALAIDPSRERAAYVGAVAREIEAHRSALQARGVEYVRFGLTEPLDGALGRFLAARRRARGAG